MTKNTVLHVVESLNFGGVESHMRNIALNAHMSAFEHSISVIAGGGAIADELIAAEFPVVVLGKRSKIPSPSAILALVTEIRSRRPSILHCHGAEANFHGLIAGKICRVPVCIAEEIGFPNHSMKARLVFRFVYKIAHAVIAISEAVRNKLIDFNEVGAEKTQVLHNPVQMHSMREPFFRSDSFNIGFVGRLEKVKNPIALVQAAVLLRDRGLPVRITIVGDGSQWTILNDEIDRANLKGEFDLHGFEAQPFGILEEIDLYVQPSISEGFGLALVEAMSMGIPTLASPVGGAPEIITDGKSGWLLADTSSEAVASGIEKCMKLTPSELEAIGRRGRESVVERFAPAVYFGKCDALYDRLLKVKKGSKG